MKGESHSLATYRCVHRKAVTGSMTMEVIVAEGQQCCHRQLLVYLPFPARSGIPTHGIVSSLTILSSPGWRGRRRDLTSRTARSLIAVQYSGESRATKPGVAFPVVLASTAMRPTAFE